MSILPFTKMHGLGNDFAIVQAQHVNKQKLPVSKLADRHVGIGFDQLLIIGPATRADFFCQIFNADGSEAEQCGNGLRCLARYIHESGLNTANTFTIETKAGIFPLHIQDYDHICVTMGAPLVQEKLISIDAKTTQPLQVSVLSIGNPHAILKVDSLDLTAPEELSSTISANAYFPQGANVGFMQVITPQHVRLRTFERGVGETFACGSNACAAAVAGIINGWLASQVKVEFRHGSLLIEWKGDSQPILMTGPATMVYSGEVSL